ncbi:MAG: M28 family peptidase [Acidobacteriia bacterium]|nr:M28 family peptidase [Terriglobia bacterium]
MAARRSNFLLLPAGLLLCTALGAQAQQKGMNSITVDGLRVHLSLIAGDETEGRDAPSTAVNIVSRYLATTAEHYGFKPLMPDGSFFQNIPLEVTAVSESKSRLRVISATGEEIYYCPQSFGGALRSSGAWGGEVVFVGYGLSAPEKGWDDYGSVDLSGKVIIMLEGQLPEGHALRADSQTLNSRSAVPRAKGASLVLTVISPEREKDMLARGAGFQLTPRPAMLSTYATQNQARISASPAQPRIPPQPAPNPQQAAARPAPPPGLADIRHEVAASILGISRSELEGMFASIARGQQVPQRVLNKRIELSVVTEKHADRSPNVLAVLEGSDPNLKSEYVVISAHHDHLGMRNGRPMDGADDNGSGTVAMLEIAKALALERPKRSVILAWFTGEEKGLWGSHYFVNNCPVPLEKISADLNLDMISRNDPDSLFLIASNNLSKELDASILSMNDKYSRLKFDYVYNDRTHRDRFYYRSDQYPFIRVGIPGVWLFCGTTPDYHTPNDTIARLDFRKMEKVTRLAYLVAYDIGNKPALLKLDANPEVTTRGQHNTSVESIR